MNRKSKEKIVDAIAEGIDTKSQYTSVCEAMQAYADQEMALFAEWGANEGWYIQRHLGPNTWYNYKQDLIRTTHQLITKYKEENP